MSLDRETALFFERTLREDAAAERFLRSMLKELPSNKQQDLLRCLVGSTLPRDLRATLTNAAKRLSR